MRQRVLVLAALAAAAVGCGPGADEPGAAGAGASAAGIHFTDVTAGSGLVFTTTFGEVPSTQILEGDVQPADQIITEIAGLPTGSGRKIGAF